MDYVAPWLKKQSLLLLTLPSLLLGCINEARHEPAALDDNAVSPPPSESDPCWDSSEGCACSDENEKADCGRVKESFGDYVTCSMGTRLCKDGQWGQCVGERITQRLLPDETSSAKLRPLTLGNSEVCAAGFDPCDPYCNHTTDTPGGFDPGPGFLNEVTGLTLVGTGFPDCDSLTLTPSTTNVTVSAFSPIATVPAGNAVTFTLTASPAGCVTPPFATTWTIDKVDRASIAGDTNANGVLSVAVPLAGSITVTAYALGLNASTTINYKVNVVEAPTSSGAAAPNTTAASADITAFGAWNAPNAGTAASSATWLYPYASTYLPLGLPAPVAQYRYNTTSGATRAVKLSLRYPVNVAATAATFNYSLVVGESNVVSQTAGVAANNLDPQIVIPQTAWNYFEQTARGQDVDLIVQRRRGSTLEQEKRLSVRLIDGQLKGTVFYNSYTSPLAGNTGAVLSIAPGATVPTVAVQPKSSGGTRRCTVCHSINNDGSRLIVNGQRPSGGVTFNNARRYNISDSSSFPAPPVLNDYNAASSDTENVPGDRFTFGAPWTDGSLYFTHGGRATGTVGVGDNNWRAPPDYSRLYNVTNASSALTVTNLPNNLLAVTPKFSRDGTKLAFAYWGGDAIPKLPSGTISSVSAGTRMVVVDFSCTTPPCTTSSTGWRITNARDVTPSVASGTNSTSGTLRVGWPAFTVDGNSVVYQRQYRTSKSSGSGGVLSGGWSPSDINTVAGALAELWISNVPANSSTAASPTRLLALNGLTSASASYLPQDSRVTPLSPLPTAYHRDNGSFTITQADGCSNTGTAASVYDYRLNYLPSVSPTEAGGKTWVIFTSRRMYGNVAYDDPWDAEPGQSCNSGIPPTKKLWVAAVDKTWTPGTDPSHPAFYLPGQELKAGNSDAYWVSSQCLDIGETCSSNDDCCDAIGTSPTTSCKVVSTETVPPARECASLDDCSAIGEACSVTADCCEGLTCPPGGGVCFSEPNALYEPQTTQREYVAECPHGTHVEWRFFEWKSTIPTGTSIDFSVQTKAKASDNYAPSAPLFMSTAAATTPTGAWARGSQTAGQILDAASLSSKRYLLVTMNFYPDDAGTVAPTLLGWRQMFDCLPAE